MRAEPLLNYTYFNPNLIIHPLKPLIPMKPQKHKTDRKSLIFALIAGSYMPLRALVTFLFDI